MNAICSAVGILHATADYASKDDALFVSLIHGGQRWNMISRLHLEVVGCMKAVY